LLQAGRVTTRDLLESQDAFLDAQNNVTAALVDYAIAKLSFFRDIGVLQVRPDGMWEQESNQHQLASRDFSVRPDTIRAESTTQRQLDFRDFLNCPPRIWEQLGHIVDSDNGTLYMAVMQGNRQNEFR